MQRKLLARTKGLPPHQPFCGPILRGRNLRGALQRFRDERFSFESMAKNSRDIISKSVRQIASLNTSLVQQTGARSPMRRARDLLAVADHVRPDGIGKAIFGDSWRGRIREDCFDAICCQRLPDGVVQICINFERGMGKPGMRRRNDDGIRQVIAMRNGSASGPAANDVAFAGLVCHVGVTAEIAEGEGRTTPAIEAKNGNSSDFEERFIHCHVQRRGFRLEVVVNVQVVEHRLD